MDWNVRAGLDGACTRARSVSGTVSFSEEKLRGSGIGDHLLVHQSKVIGDSLLVGHIGIRPIVTEVDNDRWEVRLVTVTVIERRCRVIEKIGKHHSAGVIPVPERQTERGVADQLAQDSLVEVEVPSVEREEEPRVVDLNFLVREVDLVVAAVTVSAMDKRLLVKVPGIVGRQSLHELDGLRELGDGVFVHGVSGRADLHGGHSRELVVNNVGRHGRATVIHHGAGREVGGRDDTFGDLRGLDGRGRGHGVGREASRAVEAAQAEEDISPVKLGVCAAVAGGVA